MDHEHCRFCIIDDNNDCCICGGKKINYFPPAWAFLLPHDKNCDAYIEAINGARRLRTELYDECGPYEFVEEMEERKKVQGNFYEQYVLDLWWEAAHNYPANPPKVYSYGN
jgi:hypothetical protein